MYRVGDSSGVEAECLGQITGKLLKIVGHMDTTAKGARRSRASIAIVWHKDSNGLVGLSDNDFRACLDLDQKGQSFGLCFGYAVDDHCVDG